MLVLVVGTVLGLSLSFGGEFIARLSAVEEEDLSWEQARLFAEVMDRIKEDYVEPINDRELMESAIRGMVADLDAHSQYLDADEYQDIRISTSGSYSGVGLEVSSAEGEILVVAPIDGTPAFRAGILPGDKIVAIDDASISKDGLQETIDRLRGRAGTRVTVSIMRGPQAELLVFNLRRENIRVASVRYDTVEPDLGYVRISQFSESTATELSRAVDALVAEYARAGGKLRGVVLDLRNNPGGILDSAVDVSDLFLDGGLIVSAEGRTDSARFAHKAGLGDVLDGAPMGCAGESGLRVRFRNRRRRTAGSSPRARRGHIDLRQRIGADGDAVVARASDQVNDFALFHAVRRLDSGHRHSAGHRGGRRHPFSCA